MKMKGMVIVFFWIMLIPTTLLILSYYPSIGRIEKWAIASVIALAYVFIFRKTLKMKLFWICINFSGGGVMLSLNFKYTLLLSILLSACTHSTGGNEKDSQCFSSAYVNRHIKDSVHRKIMYDRCLRENKTYLINNSYWVLVWSFYGDCYCNLYCIYLFFYLQIYLPVVNIWV